MRASATPAIGSATARAYASSSTTSGSFSQPREPDELRRDARLVERASCSGTNSRLLRHRTAKLDHGSGSAPVASSDRADPLGDPRGLGPFVRQPDDLDLALAVRRPRHQLLAGVGPLFGRKRRDDAVGGGEDPGPGAEVRVQRQLPGLGAVRPAEPLGELEQVEQARPAPRVDVLVRIADGRDGEPLAEDLGDERGLGHVRVLVLVEQRRPVPVAILPRHRREPLDDLERQRDLVAEVDHAQLALQLAEPDGGAGKLDPLEGGLRHPVAGGDDPQLLEAFQVEANDLLGLDAVVRRLLGQLEDLRDQRRLPLRRDLLEGHLVEHARTALRAPALDRIRWPGSMPASRPCRSRISAANPW